MGVTHEAIFGDDPNVAAATPGSYGEAPSGYRIPPASRLGPVTLQVSSLQRSLEYYQNLLGFHVAKADSTDAVLTAHGDSTPIVHLRASPGARPLARSSRLGLYHFAILLPNRAELGRFALHLAGTHVRAGSADHLVSESLYLWDPDGLGIEVYADRPQTSWRRVGRELMMATDPLDANSLVREAGETPWAGMPAGATIGHLHLHVGDLTQGSKYYSEALGFDRMVWSYPGALFLSFGGYHHHLGTNTWAAAAPPPREDDCRLLEWVIELPEADDLAAAAASLATKGYGTERSGDGIRTQDPWGTGLRLTSRGQDAAASNADRH